jgi:hypothetical protein
LGLLRTEFCEKFTKESVLGLPVSIRRIARMLRLDAVVLFEDVAISKQVVAQAQENIFLGPRTTTWTPSGRSHPSSSPKLANVLDQFSVCFLSNRGLSVATTAVN